MPVCEPLAVPPGHKILLATPAGVDQVILRALHRPQQLEVLEARGAVDGALTRGETLLQRGRALRRNGQDVDGDVGHALSLPSGCSRGTLEAMTAQTEDPADPGLYGPESVTWRVHGDPSMPLAGLRALLLQAVHPLAMAGVAQHSDFRTDPWGRLFRTAEYVAVTTYGTTRQAQRAGAKVRGIHGKLGGTEPESGQRYRVNDPELLRWVHCVEVESFLTTAVRCGLRLSRAEQDTYYAEQRRGAAMVGLDPAQVPADVAAMRGYFQDIRPQLQVTAEARRAARFVLWPPMPALVGLGTPARPAWIALAAAAAAMLPRWARRLYRLPGIPTTDLGATAAGLAFRSGLLVVPSSLRQGPHHKAALERVGRA